jgi:predicted Zn-dependent protease
MAHIQLNHVMKKLVKEMGLSVVMSITTGKDGETVSQTAKILSSSAFDRGLEKEADIKAVDYLVKAKIDPEPFAQFLYNMDDGSSEYLTWINTHPESRERAMYILEYSADKKGIYKAVLDSIPWVTLQENVSR